MYGIWVVFRFVFAERKTILATEWSARKAACLQGRHEIARHLLVMPFFIPVITHLLESIGRRFAFADCVAQKGVRVVNWVLGIRRENRSAVLAVLIKFARCGGSLDVNPTWWPSRLPSG